MIKRLGKAGTYRTYTDDAGVVCVSCYKNLAKAGLKLFYCFCCGGELHGSTACTEPHGDTAIRCVDCVDGEL